MGAAEHRGGSGMTDLRRLAEQATPGPWRVLIESYDDRTLFVGSPDYTVAGGIRDDADAAYIAAANPQTITRLLDEHERLQVALDAVGDRKDEARHAQQAAERRVEELAKARAALEELVRAAEVYISHYVPVEAARIDGFDPESWASEARALLDPQWKWQGVDTERLTSLDPAAPPADDRTPYQSPDLHTGTEHSDRVLTDDK